MKYLRNFFETCLLFYFSGLVAARIYSVCVRRHTGQNVDAGRDDLRPEERAENAVIQTRVHRLHTQTSVSATALHAKGVFTVNDIKCSGRTQVLYKALVLYCALFSQSCFFLWKLLKSAFLCFIF